MTHLPSGLGSTMRMVVAMNSSTIDHPTLVLVHAALNILAEESGVRNSSTYSCSLRDRQIYLSSSRDDDR